MHSDETKSQFIELRAKGFSLARISEQIGVSKRTLVDWNRHHCLELQALRSVEIEALEEKILATREQELSRLAAHQNAIEKELLGRRFSGLPVDKLFRLSFIVRDQIEKLRQKPVPEDMPESNPPVDQKNCTISAPVSAPLDFPQESASPLEPGQ